MAVGDSHAFPSFITPVLTQISFQSHWLLFSHASAAVSGENKLERKFASTGYPTHDHQVINPTHSPLSHLGRARACLGKLCLVISKGNYSQNMAIRQEIKVAELWFLRTALLHIVC